jgi:long-chain fatty acid transport protein
MTGGHRLRRRSATPWLAAHAVLAISTTPAIARGAGFASQQFGGEHGNVTETNPLALYYNPGGLGFSDHVELGLYGTLAFRHATWTHPQAADDYLDPAGAQGADTGKASLFNVFGGPTLAGSVHLTNDLVVAGGLFAPFYGPFSWDKNQAFAGSTKYPQAVDGVQRWFGISGQIAVLYFSAGAAYKLGPLSIGASGSFITSSVSLLQARNIAGAGKPDVTEEGRGSFSVQGFNGSFGVGLMLEAIPEQLYLSTSYQSQPGLGAQALEGGLDVTPPGMKASHYDVTLHQSLPDVVRLGGRFHPAGLPWEFRLFGDYTRWSVLANQCLAEGGGVCAVGPTGAALTGPGDATVLANVRRDWKDTWGVRSGASFWPLQAVEAFAGIGYESSAVPGETMAPDIPDADKILVALGARIALTERLFLTASYTHLQYFDRDVSTTRSTLATGASGTPYVYPTVEGNGGGDYTQWVGLVSGNLEAVF